MANNRFHAAVNRESAHTNAHTAITEFGKLNVELPTAVTQAHHALVTLEGRQPQQPEPNAVRELYAAAATDKAIDAALADAANFQARRNAWSQARADLGLTVTKTILANADEIHDQLAALAEPLIDDITAAARIDDPLTKLVADGRNDEARLVAAAEINVEQLVHLYRLRDTYLSSPKASTSAGHYDGSVFEPTDDIKPSNGATTWEAWRNTIRNGGQLWFPTVDEAGAAAHEAWERYCAAHKADQGNASYAAF